MTFNDIASQVCTTIGELDSDSLNFAISKAITRYVTLWNSYDWPETKNLITLTVPGNQTSVFTDSPYEGIKSIGVRPQLNLAPIPIPYREIGWIRENAPGLATPNINAIVPSYYWNSRTMGVPLDPITSISFGVTASTGDSVFINIHGLTTDASTGLSVEKSEQLSISTTSPGTFPTSNVFTSIFSLSKSAGNSSISVFLSGSMTASFVMPPTEKTMRFNQYAYYPVPQSSWFLDLELKVRAPEFYELNANDVPAIRNLDNALISYVLSDMLKRQRQYGKAQQELQLAGEYVQGAKDKIREQENFFNQISPDVYDSTDINGRMTWRPTSSFF